MNIEYKDADDYTTERVRQYESFFDDIKDETWKIQEDKPEDSTEFPEDFLQFIMDQSNILIDSDSNSEQRLKAILNLCESLNNFPHSVRKIAFNNDTLYSIIQIISEKENLEFLPQCISLLKIFLIHLPGEVIQNCIDVNLVLAIDICFEYEITFKIAADLIELLAILASFKEDKIFQQMKNINVISRICDILSCIHNQIIPSRDRDSLQELPFIEQDIDLEDSLLIFPLLVFIFHYFNWDERSTYIISNELMEHLLCLLQMSMSERDTCCCLNTFMNVTTKNSYNLFQKAHKRMKLPTCEKILEIVINSEPNSKIQEFAIKTIFNIASNDDEYLFLDIDYINPIFSLIECEQINDNLREKLILIIETLSYDACRYEGKKIKSIMPDNIVDTFKLHYLRKIFDDSSYRIRSHIGGIFINLLEKRKYQEKILNEINIFEIFLPLIHTENCKCVESICILLKNLIENERDPKIQSNFCISIAEEYIADDYIDNDSDINAHIAVSQLQGLVDNILKCEV